VVQYIVNFKVLDYFTICLEIQNYKRVNQKLLSKKTVVDMTNSEVNFVFGNLNSRGGGERLTLVTMRTALNMGVKSFDLTTLYRPNVAQLNQSFGRKLSSVVKNLRRIYLISIVDYLEKSNLVTKYNSKRGLVTINTPGD